MFTRFLRWLERRGSYRMISREGQPYMARYYLLRLRGHGLFVHRFWNDDPDGVHDHPWNWARWILKGWYEENAVDGGFEFCQAGSFRWNQAERLHRIRVHPEMRGQVWTLFWHGKRRRGWGFIAGPGEPWRSARELGLQDDREMTGWLFPRFVDEARREG